MQEERNDSEIKRYPETNISTELVEPGVGLRNRSGKLGQGLSQRKG